MTGSKDSCTSQSKVVVSLTCFFARSLPGCAMAWGWVPGGLPFTTRRARASVTTCLSSPSLAASRDRSPSICSCSDLTTGGRWVACRRVFRKAGNLSLFEFFSLEVRTYNYTEHTAIVPIPVGPCCTCTFNASHALRPTSTSRHLIGCNVYRCSSTSLLPHSVGPSTYMITCSLS